MHRKTETRAPGKPLASSVATLVRGCFGFAVSSDVNKDRKPGIARIFAVSVAGSSDRVSAAIPHRVLYGFLQRHPD